MNLQLSIDEFIARETDAPVSDHEIRASRADQSRAGLPEHLLSDEAIRRIVRAERAADKFLAAPKLMYAQRLAGIAGKQ